MGIEGIPVTKWHGCYEKRWDKRIVPDAFVHPAKASRALIVRIYNYLLDLHMLQQGKTVLDPFAGIGTTAIEGANRGIKVIGVELEPKFVELAQANVEKHRRYWTGMGYPIPITVQGDSRQLRKVLSETDAVISSPPYAEIATGAGGLNTKPPKHEGQQGGRSAKSPSQDTDQRYGETKGQMARMEKGDVEAVISSPPCVMHDGNGARRNRAANLEAAGIDSKAWLGERRCTQGRSKGNGDTDGQLTQMEEGELDEIGSPSETFWSAAHQVVRETYAVLKPGGVAVWVVKEFVRHKQLVDFPGDWRKLCEHVGFQTLEEIHSLFAKETVRNGQVVWLERKSFFRRLAESKGSPRIDWEVVWIMQKPMVERG